MRVGSVAPNNASNQTRFFKNRTNRSFPQLDPALFPRKPGIDSPQPPGDARLVQVIRRHFHLHSVADRESHPTFSHFAANRRQHDVLVRQLNAEHRAGENYCYDAFYFNVLFFCLYHLVFLEVCRNTKPRSGRPSGREQGKKERGLV
jgi:hypothetical protein